jgi:hypothetical protein
LCCWRTDACASGSGAPRATALYCSARVLKHGAGGRDTMLDSFRMFLYTYTFGERPTPDERAAPLVDGNLFESVGAYTHKYMDSLLVRTLERWSADPRLTHEGLPRAQNAMSSAARRDFLHHMDRAQVRHVFTDDYVHALRQLQQSTSVAGATTQAAAQDIQLPKRQKVRIK